MRFRHRLIGAWWQEEHGFWNLLFEVHDDSGQVAFYESVAEVLINAGGILKLVDLSSVLSLLYHS
jgi:hypothetical protein